MEARPPKTVRNGYSRRPQRNVSIRRIFGQILSTSVAERKVPEAPVDNEHVKFGGSVAFGWLSNDFDDAGYIGDQRANAERGAELFNHAVERIGEQMAEIRTNFGR